MTNAVVKMLSFMLIMVYANVVATKQLTNPI